MSDLINQKTICETCTHKAVCGKYTATGGVDKCRHYDEPKRGRWKGAGMLEEGVCPDKDCNFNTARGNTAVR